MTADATTIDYDALQREALRNLVRSVLLEVAEHGLPGQHHFYISYDVRSPGVALSKRLREKYPSEMTIVLQHRFWDLIVGEDRFEVKLTFDSIPERLVVPFSAIKVFLDPSVKFIVHFDDAGATDRDLGPTSIDGRGANPARKRIPRTKPRPERAGAPQVTLAAETPPGERRLPAAKSPAVVGPVDAAAALSQGNEKAGDRDTRPPSESPSDAADAAAVPASTGAQVVSLDAFRKK